MIENVTIGADPELFIVNTKTGKIVSSIGLIPGEKGDPFKPEGLPWGYGLEIDNILAEFNIPPCYTLEEFSTAMETMKNYIRDYVKRVNPNYDILCTSSMDVDPAILDNPIACLFGCDPDFNAYTQKQNPKPKGEKTTRRSAGLHVHCGYDNPNTVDSVTLIKWLDIYLGIPSVIFDTDKQRRTLYGKAGAFRLQDWGVEYRTLSGHFLSNPKYYTFIWQGLTQAVYAVNHDLVFPISGEEVQRIINEGDSEAAIKACKKYGLCDYKFYL